MAGSINRMRANKSIAEWTLAMEILAAHDGDVFAASNAAKEAVGHGLSEDETNHIVYLIYTLDAERNGK